MEKYDDIFSTIKTIVREDGTEEKIHIPIMSMGFESDEYELDEDVTFSTTLEAEGAPGGPPAMGADPTGGADTGGGEAPPDADMGGDPSADGMGGGMDDMGGGMDGGMGGGGGGASSGGGGAPKEDDDNAELADYRIRAIEQNKKVKEDLDNLSENIQELRTSGKVKSNDDIKTIEKILVDIINSKANLIKIIQDLANMKHKSRTEARTINLLINKEISEVYRDARNLLKKYI